MIKESLMNEVRRENAKEAIKAVETIISYCRLTNCSQCPFSENGACYLFTNDPEMPTDWDLNDLKMD